VNHEESIGDVYIWVREDGSAQLTVEGKYSNERDEIKITAEHRPAVALALLGGLTDELVERAAKSYWNDFHSAPWSECRNKVDFRVTARSMLDAVFGVTYP